MQKTQTHFGLMALLGIPAGIIGAFVKWGGEVPLPPRSPQDMFEAACGAEKLIRSADTIDCSRNFLNRPMSFCAIILGLATQMPRFTPSQATRLTRSC
nr:hypothetical protein [uncultured Campylobacter sp.]